MTPKYIEDAIAERDNRIWWASQLSMLDTIKRQSKFSELTFGPAGGKINLLGVIDHIEKELNELKEEPFDLEEWIDVLILAIDGAWRAGYTPDQIIEGWVKKIKKNEERKWPDWRTAEPGKAIEHIREETHS